MAQKRNYMSGLSAQMDSIKMVDEKGSTVAGEAKNDDKAGMLEVNSVGEDYRDKKLAVFVDTDVYLRLNTLISHINAYRKRGNMTTMDCVIYNAVLEYLDKHEGEVAEFHDIRSMVSKPTLPNRK